LHRKLAPCVTFRPIFVSVLFIFELGARNAAFRTTAALVEHFSNISVVLRQANDALKNLLQKCVHLPALEPLLHDAPANVLKHVVRQFSEVLPHDVKARHLFITSLGLKKVQEIEAEPGSALAEYINTINSCFPEEIIL